MYRHIKRILDVALSMVGLIVLSPIFLIISIAIKVSSSGPVLFKQKRIGVGKKQFFIFKFRTMYVNAPKDTPTHLLNKSESYITPVGRILRASSLDELPQLINILVGQMSIVGPRPALYNQYDLIEAREMVGANSLRPGLTGWAQVNGRDELPLDVKARLDGEYVRNISFIFDVKCILYTVSSVLLHKGVREGSSQSEEGDHAA